MCTKDYCICRLHFVGENGQEKEDPDPTSAAASKGKVKIHLCMFVNAVSRLKKCLLTPVRVVRCLIVLLGILNSCSSRKLNFFHRSFDNFLMKFIQPNSK